MACRYAYCVLLILRFFFFNLFHFVNLVSFYLTNLCSIFQTVWIHFVGSQDGHTNSIVSNEAPKKTETAVIFDCIKFNLKSLFTTFIFIITWNICISYLFCLLMLQKYLFFHFCRTCVSTQVLYRRAVTCSFVRSSTIDSWAQLLLQFLANHFETSQMFWPWCVDVHIICS